MRPAPGPGAPGQEKTDFLNAERQQESGGNYRIVNPGSGALGAWQVMPSNLPDWLAAAGLPPMTAQQFLYDDAAQNRVAWVILGGYYDTYGPAGAAAMWYSGQSDPNKTYGDPPVYQYVDDVLALMGQELPSPNYGTPPGGQYFTLPPPNTADWSPTIRGTGTVLMNAGHQAAAAAAVISSLRLGVGNGTSDIPRTR